MVSDLACPGCGGRLQVQFYREMTDCWILHCNTCGALVDTFGDLGSQPLEIIPTRP